MPKDIKAIKRNESMLGAKEEAEIVGLLTPEHVAEKLGVSKAMVYKLVRNGQLDAVHVGRLVRIVPDSYRRFIGQRTETGL